MAEFTMTVPDGILAGVLDAFEHSYPIPLDGDEMPTMTPVQNAKDQLVNYVRSIYKAYKATTEAETARVAAAAAADIASAGIEVA